MSNQSTPSSTSAPSAEAKQGAGGGKGSLIASWIAQLAAAGVLAVGAIPKFTGGAGALAEKLPGGIATVTAIGVIEIVAIILLLVPKTAVYGAALAFMVMLGAVASHLFGPVGMEGELGSMLPLALIGLAANATAFGLRCKELPFFKKG